MTLERISWTSSPNGSANGSTNGARVNVGEEEREPETLEGLHGSTNGVGGERWEPPSGDRLIKSSNGFHAAEGNRWSGGVPVRGLGSSVYVERSVVADDPSGREFRHYLGVLRRRMGIVVLVPILAVGVALGLALSSPRVYEASADVRLTLGTQQSVFSDSVGAQTDAARQVDTEIAVLQSSPIARAVDKKLGSAASAVSSVAVAGVGVTDLIRVTVQSASPAVARRAANLYASSYITTRREQAVDDLVAAGAVLETKLLDVRAQIDGAATTAERDALSAQYQLLKDKLDQVQVDASLGRGGARVVAPATTPASPVSPQPLRDAVVALVVGLMLGIVLAFMLEFLDDKTHTAEDVARYGDGLTVLAEVPAVPGWRNRKATRVVALEDPMSPAAESYRALRTSLQIIGLRRRVQTILVTSPMAAEGKTTTAANLGVTLARAGRRVVLVDLDLRRPRLERFFGLDNSVGVTSVLVGDTPLSETLHQVEVAEGVPPLQVLGSGPVPSNPSEVLGAGQISELLASLQAFADLVIIDAPPLLPVTDALVLSNRVDGVLLIVAADTTRRRHLGRAVDLLHRAEAPVLGAVLNNASRDHRRGYGRVYDYTQNASNTNTDHAHPTPANAK